MVINELLTDSYNDAFTCTHNYDFLVIFCYSRNSYGNL